MGTEFTEPWNREILQLPFRTICLRRRSDPRCKVNGLTEQQQAESLSMEHSAHHIWDLDLGFSGITKVISSTTESSSKGDLVQNGLPG